MGYIEIPVETEPVDLADEAFAYIEAKIPGWLPSPPNLEAWLIEALAQLASELRELAALVPETIFEYYGETILGLPPYAATAASGTTTWTAVDAGGYYIEAGTLVAITPPATSDSYAYEVVDRTFIGASVSGVEIRALETGAAASGISGVVQMLDGLDFIQSVTLDAPTSGGTDPETIEHYLDRLSNLLTLLSPRPILPQDFAVLVQQSIPAVARATAIDLYNPGPPINANCPRCVTVAVVDETGNAVPAQVKADADALLQATREVNFLAFVVDPTYTTIDVAVTFAPYPGYVGAEVAAQVQADLAAYLSPQNWGVPPYGDTSAISWLNDTTVRYLELAEVVNRTDGVRYVLALSFAKSGQAKGQADVVMTGVAPLPRPGVITAAAG